MTGLLVFVVGMALIVAAFAGVGRWLLLAGVIVLGAGLTMALTGWPDRG